MPRLIAFLFVASLLAAAGSPFAARAETIRVVAGDSDDVIALVGEPVRRTQSSVTARVVEVHRGRGAFDGYVVNVVEYDCAWMKQRLRAYRRFNAAGGLEQSYDNGEWGGVYASGRGDVMRAYLCSGTGQPVEAAFTDAAAFAQAFLAGRWVYP